EKERRRNVAPFYAFLQFVFARRKVQKSDFILPRYLEHTRDEWADYFKIVKRSDRLAQMIDKTLLPIFSIADNLSVYYARLFRGTFIFNYLASALVATFGVLGIMMHGNVVVHVLDIIALILVFAVIVNWWIAQKFEFHRRALEYRRLAEGLRHMRL